LEENPGERELHLLRLGTLCSDGRVEEEADGALRHIGDPTETAIVAAARAAGLDKEKLELDYPRAAELPFDSDRKLMTTVHDMGGRLVAITKGGFDTLLPRCLNPEKSAAQINRVMGEGALRVLAIACRELDSLPPVIDSAHLERDLVFMGLIGMIDPPREESRRAVALCREAGIRTVMITGDHVVTAGAIARELGILREGDQAVSGPELAAMDDEALAQNIHRYSVYARVSPEDKIRIVKAWQEQGEVVAMTGDGVNDAPALRAADIGCAMGITGTDVAKNAAAMVLTDDNFSTIVEAVRQGRGIFDNIKKTVQFLLSCNLGELCAIFIAMLLGWGAPLLAIHLLLINVVTDAFPALALGLEPVDRNIMRRRPVPQSQGLFADGLGARILIQGILVGLLTLAGYYIGWTRKLSFFVPPSREVGMTMAFLVLCLSQLSQAVNCRGSRSIFRMGLTTNRAMVLAILFSAGVAVLICAVPLFAGIFHLTDLSMYHWITALVLSVMPLVFGEITKLFFRMRERANRNEAMPRDN
ncbi:MAG: cation-translocating P-type ATPase, partial [Oscillospiraceae bacterium]|nr:cation-translocating P-type ATPase [Oscillospiraceae bacterium]